MRRSVAALALVILAAHLLTLSRYGFYRDELYFLICFKHLAWGFADEPPLVPLISGLTFALHGSPYGTRILVAIAAALTVLACAAIARELGAGRFGQLVAAIATALMPASLFLGNTLTTTSFEPLTWTLCVLLAIKLCRVIPVEGSALSSRARVRESAPDVEGSAWWYLLALIFTIAAAAYMKYSIFLLVAALVVGAALYRRWRLALWIATAGAAAILLLAPNIAWQAAHGFPMLAVLQGDEFHRHGLNSGLQLEYSGAWQNVAAFLVEQLVYTGPVSAPLWIAGIVVLLRRRELRDAAFVGAAYAVATLLALVLLAKGYYIIGIYPSLFAAGATWLERVAGPARRAYVAALVAAGLIAAPLTIPVLPVDGLIAYMHAFGAPNKLVQPAFADEFGWEALTRAVAGYYRELPARMRAQTPVFADTYGDAAAIEYYGPKYGLPTPISAKDQYYLWGTRGYSLARMLAVGASEYWVLKTLYRNVRMVGTFSDPYRWVLEGPTPIYICTDPIVPPAKIWPSLKWFGEYGPPASP
jgi:hypothetical protein